MKCSSCGSVELAKVGCKHSGHWHGAVGDCGVRCAFGLLKSGDLTKQHWGCCLSTDPDAGCSQSPHDFISNDLVTVRCYSHPHVSGIYVNRRHEAGLATLSLQDDGVGLLKFGDVIVARNDRGLQELGWSIPMILEGARDSSALDGFVVLSSRSTNNVSLCVKCHCVLLNGQASSNCVHSGSFHRSYGDCSSKCVVKTEKLGTQHWSCCGSLTEHAAECKVASHQSDRDLSFDRYFRAVHASTGRLYSGHNKSNDPEYLGPESCRQGWLGLVCMVFDGGKKLTLVVRVDEPWAEVQLQVQARFGVPLYEQKFDFRLNGIAPLPHACVREAGIASGTVVELSRVPLPVFNRSRFRVCVVGAGPVGLWTALLFRLTLPFAEVTVFEKRNEYNRSHALRISDWAFEGLPISDSPVLARLHKQFVPRTKTQTVEARLKEEALLAGVVVVMGKLVDEPPPPNKFDLIVGCDGKSSAMRRYVCANQLAVDKKLGSLLQIKFQAAGRILPNDHENRSKQFFGNLAFQSQFFQVSLCFSFCFVLFSFLDSCVQHSRRRQIHSHHCVQFVERRRCFCGESDECSSC